MTFNFVVLAADLTSFNNKRTIPAGTYAIDKVTKLTGDNGDAVFFTAPDGKPVGYAVNDFDRFGIQFA